MDTSQNNQSPNPQNNVNTNPETDDKPSIGLSILSFFIPIVGIILAAVNWKSKPTSAKRYLIISGVAFAFCIIVNIASPDKQSSSNSESLSNNEDTFGYDNSVPSTTYNSVPSTTCSQGEECHISKWKVTGSITSVLSSLKLSNVCWQNKPISLGDAFDCSVMQGSIESFQNEIELGNSRKIEAYKKIMSKKVLSCAKASNNEKLQEVAKECNGKWF